jgi:photosystem II stability/assembly factor-like uncharacterized protein
MTDELLDRVRAVDPLPRGSTAPPFDSVFAPVADRSTRRDRRRRRRLLGLLVPAVSLAVAIGVMVAAVTMLHADHSGGRLTANGHRHAPNTTTTVTSAHTPSLPSGGMSGVVTVSGAAFNSSGDGLISLEQCLGCKPDGNQTSRSTVSAWLLSTTDGGRAWTRSERGYDLQGPLLAGQDGWAGGLQLLSRKQGGGAAKWEPGSGIARYFVTHDGGRSWSAAPSTAPNEGGSVPSLVGRQVWAVGLSSKVTVLHSLAQEKGLIATPSQPIRSDDTNVHVQGAGAGSAYVVSADVPGQAFATHDDGRSWQRLTPPPCTGRYAYASLDAAFGQTVWITCSGGNNRTPMLVRSLDSGRTWHQLPLGWGKVGPQQLVAVNPHVAWALSDRGELLRTTNAGTTWQPVWSATDRRVSPLSRPIRNLTAGPLPILSVQSADSASIVTLLNRGLRKRHANLTNLVVYRTINGGQSWQAYAVGL